MPWGIAAPLQHSSVVPSRQPPPHGFWQGQLISPQVLVEQLHAALWPFEACKEQVALPLESQLMVKVTVTLPSQAVPQAELALPGHWV